MTVTTTANSISYAGNGTTTAFAFPYIFFAPTDLVVTLVVTATSVPVSPAPVLNGAATYDYTVTGVVSGGEYASGATVTFNTAPLGSHTAVIQRAVPATQTVTLIDNTKFPADTINAEFDKLTILAQQSTFLTSTSLQIPSYEAGLVVTAVPAANRANKLLLWDGLGNLSTLDPASIIGGSVPAGPASGDLAGTYPGPTIKANVALTGNPTAPTPTAGDSDTSIATTAFVTTAINASGFRLLQRTVVSSAVATVQIQNIPTDINDLMFTFDLIPSTADVACTFQVYDAVGTIDNISGHYKWSLSQSVDSGAAGANVTQVSSTSSTITTAVLMSHAVAGAMVGTVRGIRGSGTVPNIKGASTKGMSFNSVYIDNAVANYRTMNGGGMRDVLGAITGIRLGFTTGNVASGAFSVWGSP